MDKEALYGFPCVENPHDFEPDRECCTDAEIAFWEDAKARWDAGERDVRGARCGWGKEGDAVVHVTRTSWGIGINYVEIEDEDGRGGSSDAEQGCRAGMKGRRWTVRERDGHCWSRTLRFMGLWQRTTCRAQSIENCPPFWT